MKTRTAVATAFVITLIGGVAMAAPSQFLFAYPGYSVQWQKGEGVPDADGSNSRHGLYLARVETTKSTNEGSGIVFGNVKGITLTELGFEVRNDGVCGFYPRYRVETTDGLVYYFRCQRGTHTPSFNNWTRVRFSSLDAEPEVLGQPPFLFGSSHIDHLSIRFHLDAGTGFTYLDDLDINGTLIGKPGR